MCSWGRASRCQLSLGRGRYLDQDRPGECQAGVPECQAVGTSCQDVLSGSQGWRKLLECFGG